MMIVPPVPGAGFGPSADEVQDALSAPAARTSAAPVRMRRRRELSNRWDTTLIRHPPLFP